ncbi:hypothetical protein FM101_03365 [Arthrobacter rhombi]|uniref:Uncharacterized protein n=1 Tax=Arthrobacter rhombi TaxID=71253 RepID=A0A1R4FCM9_9MICC|nr:hypothetical protein FM101_03365 [Arthrobacter rhombi]
MAFSYHQTGQHAAAPGAAGHPCRGCPDGGTRGFGGCMEHSAA